MVNLNCLKTQRKKKDESGNWVTEIWQDGEYKGKPYYYLANGKWKRGYECNMDGGITTDGDLVVCKADNNDNTDMPCTGVIYGYRTTFEKAYDQFVKDNKRHKGVVWHYRVDGQYVEETDTKNTYAQRIPDPSGKNIQPNENYKDKTSDSTVMLTLLRTGMAIHIHREKVPRKKYMKK